MKIEAIAVDCSAQINAYVDGRYAEHVRIGFRDDKLRDEFVRLINAGQKLLEMEKLACDQWKKETSDQRPGNICCGGCNRWFSGSLCPNCNENRNRKALDLLDKWETVDWEQRRWELATEIFIRSAQGRDAQEYCIRQADEFIAEFRKEPKP